AGPEECDLGEKNGTSEDLENRCDLTCRSPRVCGDGVADTDLGEECDLGPNNGVKLDDSMQPASDPQGTTGIVYCTEQCLIPVIPR
ncbi:MAG TPA: hypothetical protein VIM73_11205, partial [Polyangiaceae bacterium]